MGKILYLNEIIKFAVEKEQQSYELYKTLYDLTPETEAGTRGVFKTLMAQEKHHEEFYANMLTETEEQQSPGIKEDDEYIEYMQELITASRKIAPVASLDFTDLDAVANYAIDREKDSILFYLALKNYAPQTTHDAIDDIIREEGKHIVMLEKLYNLTGGGCGGNCGGCGGGCH